MKNFFTSKVFKAGNTIASFALLAGFAAFLVFIVNPSINPDRLGAQAGKGGSATAPGAPTLDTAIASDAAVALSWTAPRSDGGAAISSYSIRYSDGRNSNTINTGRSTTTQTVSGLTNGSTYSFTVAAINSAGTGTASNSLSATPSARATTPDAPTNLSATAGDAEVALTWDAPAENGGADITSYTVSYTPRGGTETTVNAGNVTSYTITSLTNDVVYTIKVAAKNSEGLGAYSTTVDATPESVAATPGIPTNLSATTSNQSARLTWTAPADNGGSDITGYVVSYTPQGGSEATVDVGNVVSYNLTNLTNGTRYSVKVLAKNVNGDGSYSSPVSVIPSTVPGTPADIATTPGDGTLAVSWTAPANTGGATITGYTISYTPSGGSETTIDVPGASSSYTLENLTNGVVYTVKILATNTNGNSSYSSTATGSPDENTAPAIVGVPSVTPGDTSAVITWATNKITSTRVNFGLLNITTSTPEYNRNSRVVNHSVTVNDLVPCTTYSYKVQSYDASSREAVSSQQTFTTTGCVATVQEITRDSVDTTSGGTLDFASSSDEVKTRLAVPANLKTGETDVIFQVKKLEKEATKTEIGKPDSRVEWLGEHVYNLTAYGSESTEVNNFDNPVTVTIEYSREDIQGFDLNTLTIHHYEEGIGWRSLESCTNTYNPNTGLGEISCQTSSFSIFGLFGENAVGGSSSSGSYLPSSVASSTQTNSEETSVDMVDGEEEIVAEELENNSVPSSLVLPEFSKDLWRGINNSLDVFNLQKFLNAQGFILAEEGPGSPGKETSYFGPRTQDALKRFQEAYADQILFPVGVPDPTGHLGQWTRKFIEDNFNSDIQ